MPVSILKKPTEKFNWSIISINDESRLEAALSRLETYYIGLLAAGLLLSLFISFFIAKYIRNPLYVLKTKMKRVEQGDLTTTVTINRNDEFGDLSRAFDRMLQQIVELIRRAELHNELERKLEIQVEDGLMDFPVFRMLLQSIVENSIFHGYNGGEIEGSITIHAYREGGGIMIEVVDQGEGIQTVRIKHILISEPSDVEVKGKESG